MSLHTIGAFARAAGLSAKALRHYDELGLLRPAEVDPFTGYRYYRAEQLEQARLVAHLRRIGVPLGTIRELCGLAPERAAEQLTAYWERVLAATAERQQLVDLLVDRLTGRDPAVPTLTLHCAARTDTGLVRTSNEDLAHADPGLLAVADGFGGTGHGAAAIDALRRFDATAAGPGDLLNLLGEALHSSRPAAPGGSTLTALLLSGDRLALVHIGDSRAYLLRGADLFQITHDHTLVQSMVDEGRLTAAEAASHPQRSLLLKALGGARDVDRPDFSVHEARPGDRYLLCSDGLSTVLTEDQLRTVLTTVPAPEQAVQQLVALANRAGGPDNIACAVADVTAAG
ncbi:MerR family transcriptional regulator [Kitasatospora sp. NPDC058965]|uniref:MerR family transcriptional regulator n=1 Tax=Kitasatospora sp. NPDC058965 TaxID=3346682 RepID=UPI0036B12E29